MFSIKGINYSTSSKFGLTKFFREKEKNCDFWQNIRNIQNILSKSAISVGY